LGEDQMTTSERLDGIAGSSADILPYHEGRLKHDRDELGAKQYYMLMAHCLNRKAQLTCLLEVHKLLKEARTQEEKNYVQDIARQLFENRQISENDIKLLSIKLMENV
jgi:hypothetical protein